VRDADHRREVWHERATRELFGGAPNAGHIALAELERRARLHTLVTQNVDGLHQDAGSSPAIVIEIHGTVREVACLSCGWRGPMEETLDRVRAGEADPPCLECGGLLKAATISFGQNLVPEDLARAQRAASGADVFLAVGTSLGVHPAAALPGRALRAAAALAVLNGEPTPFDPKADFVLRDRLGDLLPDLVARV
jgi:NAD-dependent deacetylase